MNDMTFDAQALLATTFVDASELAHKLAGGRVLGVISHARSAVAPDTRIPWIGPDLGPQGDPARSEVWEAAGAVEYGTRDAWTWSSDGEFFFGATAIEEDGHHIAELTGARYDALFALMRERGCEQLLRIWNYVPNINADDAAGQERYKSFCVGRSEAFARRYADMQVQLPAATGIGSRSGTICVAVLARCLDLARSNVMHVENPYQTPAYYYPRKYGPRPPSFARASSYLDSARARHYLFISGTAAVIGTETVHRGDIEQQVAVTLRNLDALISADNLRAYGVQAAYTLKDIDAIRVYVRHREHLALVEQLCSAAFSPGAAIVYLHADICRDDLDVEIEGVIARPASRAPQREGATLVDFFLDKVHADPQKTAYITLDDRGRQVDAIAFSQLHHRVMQTAACLQQRYGRDTAVILALGNSTDFVVTWFACVFAGLIAVPLPFDRKGAPLDLADKACRIAAALGMDALLYTHDDVAVEVQEAIRAGEGPALECLSRRTLIDHTVAFYRFTEQRPDAVATILFTSGSVANPKGVPLTHTNLLAAARANALAWQYREDAVSVSWMPSSHSFGLVFNLLLPLYAGASCVLMEPSDFAANPRLWLEAVSRYRATHSAAGTFGYEHCARRAGEATGLDLRSWRVALISAETVRENVCRTFQASFAAAGFGADVLAPVYGLSETGPVTVKPIGSAARFEPVIAPVIEGAWQGSVASVGRAIDGVTIVCLHPGSAIPVDAGQVGEVALAGDCVVGGYWHTSQRSEKAEEGGPFGHTVEGFDGQAFFRTGDLGFFRAGELHIVGRIKELIIKNGKNYYPTDLEAALSAGVARLEGAKSCAFSLPGEYGEQLAIAQEAPPALEADLAALHGVSEQMAAALLAKLAVTLDQVIWLPAGSLPRTASGKLQRLKCRMQYLDGQLAPLAEHAFGRRAVSGAGAPAVPHANGMQRLRAVLAAVLGMAAHDVAQAGSLGALGVDSVQYIELAKGLGEEFGIDLAAGKLYQLQDIAALAQYLGSATPGGSQDNARVDRKPEQPAPADGAIAIIGIACYLPGADNADAYWDNLVGARDCLSDIFSSERDIALQLQHYRGDASFPQRAGLIEHAETFDAAFFNITPVEAALMDPQQRKSLELASNVLEDAGYAPHDMKGREVGVFWGYHADDYKELVLARNLGSEALMNTGLHAAMLANRISHHFDLAGPSESVNTACSSALVALDKAVTALGAGACAQAIVGGINLLLSARTFDYTHASNMLNPAGYCAPLSESANGIVRSEGGCALLLKPLAQAIDDGDQIHATILSTGSSHGGRTGGLTVPSPAGQTRLIRAALRKAALAPQALGYVELHGTGTRLGDPIELQALADAFDSAGAHGQWRCGVGSVKSNLGHTEAVSGLAGLLKNVLQIRHAQRVASIHVDQVSAALGLAHSPLYVVRDNEAWDSARRIAAVSSFGLGGSIAHAIIEGGPAPAAAPGPGAPACGGEVLVPLSARSPQALHAAAANLLAHLERRPADTTSAAWLRNAAYTLQVGRAPMTHRLAIVAADAGALQDALRGYLARSISAGAGAGLVAGVADQQSPVRDLLGGASGAAFLRALIDHGELARVAALWCCGVEVRWQDLYRDQPAQRVSLPTYPFERQRHWLGGQEGRAAPERSARAVYLARDWQASTGAAGVETDAAPQRVVVLATGAGLDLAGALQGRFAAVTILRLESDNDSDSAAAMAALSFESFDGCIDLTGLEVASEDWRTIAAAQHLLMRAAAARLYLMAVTRAHGGAARGALYAMLGAEYARASSCHLASDAADTRTLAAQIVGEFAHGLPAPEILWRGGERFTPQWRALTPARRYDIDPNGAVWITGGTRGVGLLLARHLVERYGVRRLVLSGREVLPPREQWQAASSAKVRAIMALEAAGASVEVLATDLGDPQAVAAALQAIKVRFGSVTGVIHCAGVADLDTPAFIDKTPADLERCAGPKRMALEVMHAALASQAPAFIVLASSVAAALPALGAGMSDYRAANAALDDFARHQHSIGNTGVLSIQWPDWRDTGMGGAVVKGGAGLYAGLGLLSHSDQEGLALFDGALSLLHREAVVLPAMVAPDFSPAGLAQQAPQARPQVSSTALGVDQVAAWLAGVFETAFGLSTVAADACFADLGVDSVLLVGVVKRLNGQLGLSLDPSLILDHQSVPQLAAHLLATCPAPLARLLGTPATAPAPSPKAEPVSGTKRGETGAIAIVGLSCTFPGAPDKEAYWQLLTQGASAIGPMPAARAGGADGTHAAGVIGHAEYFSPAHFKLSDDDARVMDPQARLLLEQSLLTLHDAGYATQDVDGQPIGVFVGGRAHHSPDWERILAAANPVLGAGQNYLATNISRAFGLTGPSLVIDTACSSALVALHLAAQSIRAGDCRAALVAGVSLIIDDKHLALFEARDILSRDGRLHLFDARANGEVLGEGCGVVLLKPLADALAAGDHIYGILKASAVNNDGRTAGPASPNPAAQRAVIVQALAQARLDPATVGYIETSGTGSVLGDLVELKTIGAAYPPRAGRERLLGSVKPNLGHLLNAAGMAGLIRNLLSVERKCIPPFISGQVPLDHFDMAAAGLAFNRAPREHADDSLVVAQNSFPDGGTNCHVILASHGDAAYRRRRPSLPAPLLERRHYPFVAAAVTAAITATAAAAAAPDSTDDIWAFA